MQITYRAKSNLLPVSLHIFLCSQESFISEMQEYIIYRNISFVKDFICFYNVFLYLKHFFYQMQFCPHFLLVFMKMLKCSLIYHRTG